ANVAPHAGQPGRRPPRRLEFVRRRPAIDETLRHLHGVPAALVAQQRPDAPAAADGVQAQFPRAGLVGQQLEDRLRAVAGRPLGFGHHFFFSIVAMKSYTALVATSSGLPRSALIVVWSLPSTPWGVARTRAERNSFANRSDWPFVSG